LGGEKTVVLLEQGGGYTATKHVGREGSEKRGRGGYAERVHHHLNLGKKTMPFSSQEGPPKQGGEAAGQTAGKLKRGPLG